MQHITIYNEPGRYAGWPANYGIWSWGDEIVLGFTVGYHQTDGPFHARDKSKPFTSMQARSLDGGLNWEVVETPCRTPGDRGLSADEHMNEGMGVGDAIEEVNAPVDCPGEIDFTHPDFALMCAKTGLKKGVRSFFYYSTDRCHTWEGPYKLPMYEQTGIAARTDYMVSGPSTCTLFLTANKTNGKEGRIFCARSEDGGASFDFLSWIGPEPEGFAIMPASARLASGRLLVAVRCREGVLRTESERNWIDLYASDDDRASWAYLNRPVASTGIGGNPPTLTLLRDGRLCLTYGFRDAPYKMCAKLSADDGETWGEEVVLRSDGGCHDIGYPRTIQRPDGALVTAYYFNDRADGERYMAATLWQP